MRGVSRESGWPLRVKVSEVACEEQVAVVWARRECWERVTLREEFVGKLSLVSRFPQYLSHAS